MERKSWASWFAGNVRRYSAKPQPPHVYGYMNGEPVTDATKAIRLEWFTGRVDARSKLVLPDWPVGNG